MNPFRQLPPRALLPALLVALFGVVSARPALPRLDGQLISADGGVLGPMRVVLRQGTRVDSAVTAADGRFSVPRPRATGEVVLMVDQPGGAQGRFHPSIARLRPEDVPEVLNVVLVPRTWTVRAGRHAGRAVDISLELAFAPSCPNCSSFYREGVRDVSTGRLTPAPTWPGGVFPIRVAFTGDMPFQRVASRDSLAFWRIVEDLEVDFGRDLLRPARYRETLPDERGAPEDVILVESDPRLRRIGWGSTISQAGDVIYGAIRVRSPAVFAERDGPRLVKHEMLHALGVGHTCSWRTVMAQIPECANRSADDPTAEDIAYFEVLTYVRELQRVFRAPLGLEAALAGERER